MTPDLNQEALEYHSLEPAGKIKIASSKPLNNQKDLSLAYTPGVGQPCKEIAANPEDVWKYTNKGNTVAIISDGTAVLGLGNIGPEAGLPVMEGKAILFKKFADIDAYPLCIRTDDPKTAILALEPSLGGINLEDIKAPECFELQQSLDAQMKIPVFHDDQDGTAVIVVAGLINALELTNKKIEEAKVLICGAGAAGISCARLLTAFGLNKANLFMVDSKGLISTERSDTNEYKQNFAQPGPALSLADAIKDKDVFIGVSGPDLVTSEMIQSMAPDPIVFAASNPVPEIMPDKALAAGAKIVATGRSDFPNQVNNVLGFPGIFRGTLDTRSSTINNEMKTAAALALASLVKEQPQDFILEILKNAYPETSFEFSDTYIIPKPFDLRVVPRVARCVAEAAMKSGVAQVQILDLDKYEKEVFDRISQNWK